MLRITIELVGKRPMLQRNGRLANPLDPTTQRITQLAKKTNKTPEDYRELLPLEAWWGTWETPEGLVGLPTENVHACLVKAGGAYKLGTALESALLLPVLDKVEPLVFPDGLPCDAHEYAYSDPVTHLFIRTVVISGRRTLRARAIFRDWRCTHTFDLLDDIVNPASLEKVVARAGRIVGVGDWRPRYGTFNARIVDTVALSEEEEAA